MKSYYEIRPANYRKQNKQSKIKHIAKEIGNTILGMLILSIPIGLLGLAIGLIETYIK